MKQEIKVIQTDKVFNSRQEVTLDYALERLAHWYNGKQKAKKALLNNMLLETPNKYYQIEN